MRISCGRGHGVLGAGLAVSVEPGRCGPGVGERCVPGVGLAACAGPRWLCTESGSGVVLKSGGRCVLGAGLAVCVEPVRCVPGAEAVW